MAKKIQLTETELKKVIEKIIEEQLNLSQNYQQGQQQAIKNQTGVQAAKNIHNAAVAAFNGVKQTVVKIGNVAFTIVVYGAATVWLIGKGIYKVTQAVSGALLKLISATGKAVISAGQAVGQATIAAFQAAGVMIEKGAQAVGQFLTGLKDGTVSAAKWLINSCKSLGASIWGKILIGVGTIKELAGALGGWAKQQYDSIAQSLGVAWDTAVNAARKGYDALKQGVTNVANKISDTASNVYNNVKQGATNFANNVAKTAGNITQGAKNFWNNLFEMIERWVSMDGMNHSQILSESIKFNGKVIL